MMVGKHAGLPDKNTRESDPLGYNEGIEEQREDHK